MGWQLATNSIKTQSPPLLTLGLPNGSRRVPAPAPQNGETAPDPLPEERDNVNGVQALGVEATAVNQAFREQVLAAGGERHPLGQPCPPEMAGHTNAGYK